jgi:hypothetical protein
MPTVTVNASAALLVQAGPRSPAQDVAKGVIPNCGNWYSVIRQKMALFPFCGTRTFPGRSLTCKFGSNRTTDSSPAQPSQSDDEALNVANSLILRKQQWLQRLADYCPPKRLTAEQAKAQTERRVGLFPELAPLASASDARPS